MLLAIATVALVLLSPYRRISADMVPGRLGALTLNCGGTLQLDRVDWIRKETDQKQMFYFMQYDKQQQFTSVFGPMPALVGALAFLDIGDGDVISDASVRFRERLIAALLVALSAVLLVLACAAQASVPRAVTAGGVAVLSFAGAASLGQGLWQATVVLPFLVGALAAWAWRARAPRLGFVVPALLVQVVMIRPVIAPVALSLGLVWALETRTQWRRWIVATVIAVIPAVPWILWNALHQNSPLSVAQWGANKRLAAEHVFTIGAVPEAVAGLLVSPARGLLWFAPLAVVGVVVGLRRSRSAMSSSGATTAGATTAGAATSGATTSGAATSGATSGASTSGATSGASTSGGAVSADRWIAIGCMAQVLFVAAFFRWHGGQAYGPRLLAELTWVALFLALGSGARRETAVMQRDGTVPATGPVPPATVRARLGRAVLIAAAVVTVLVGQLGLWRFRPEQWERRRAPDRDPGVLWDIVDSPIPATLGPSPTVRPGDDDPALEQYRCEGGRLASERAKS